MNNDPVQPGTPEPKYVKKLEYAGPAAVVDGVEPGITGKALKVRNLADGPNGDDRGKLQLTIENNNGERESIVVYEGNLRMALLVADDQEIELPSVIVDEDELAEPTVEEECESRSTTEEPPSTPPAAEESSDKRTPPRADKE